LSNAAARGKRQRIRPASLMEKAGLKTLHGAVRCGVGGLGLAGGLGIAGGAFGCRRSRRGFRLGRRLGLGRLGGSRIGHSSVGGLRRGIRLGVGVFDAGRFGRLGVRLGSLRFGSVRFGRISSVSLRLGRGVLLFRDPRLLAVRFRRGLSIGVSRHCGDQGGAGSVRRPQARPPAIPTA
jgi:hypothetical protein